MYLLSNLTNTGYSYYNRNLLTLNANTDNLDSTHPTDIIQVFQQKLLFQDQTPAICEITLFLLNYLASY